MITLDFKGPYDLATFKTLNNVDVPGIYIWGFKQLIPNKPDVVVPYYVGIKADSILARIKQHESDIKKTDSTYLRLSNYYMGMYFYANLPNYTLPQFPSLRGNESKTKPLNWPGWNNTDFEKYIEYYNNSDFLINIKKCPTPLNQIGKKNDFPIRNTKKINDTLLNRINEKNFWIYYAVIDKTSDSYKEFRCYKKSDRATFEIIEAYVKFSLKGNTIGHSKSYGCWHGFPQIILNSCTNLFKIKPSIIFLGDY